MCGSTVRPVEVSDQESLCLKIAIIKGGHVCFTYGFTISWACPAPPTSTLPSLLFLWKGGGILSIKTPCTPGIQNYILFCPSEVASYVTKPQAGIHCKKLNSTEHNQVDAAAQINTE